MDILERYLNSGDENDHKPEFFRLKDIADKRRFEDLLKKDISFFVYDEMEGQLRELVKCLNPHLRIKPEDYPTLVEQHLNGCNIKEYGVWIYYPWSHKIVHSLDEDEFIEVRTNRNKYKLTTEEQKYLSGKKIGIIGLSVGQSIALTIAMERICGELRLADFDTAELSNLNRIRTGLYNLGLKKTIIAAREIAEIDPFINIKIFSDGLHKNNIEEFFTGDGKLDLLVEVCDGLDIKIQSRFKARELGIPVVMDTNDRGMMDIERFDLEPDRPILHGLAGDLNPDNIKDLSNEQKIPYIFKMVGIDTLSTRLKASMIEVSQSISTWPQLASSVVLGGALTTDVARRILLDQYHDSGRYYIDIDELIADKKETEAPEEQKKEIDTAAMQRIAQQYFTANTSTPAFSPSDAQVDQIILAAAKAPSYNDLQYWTHYYTQGTLFIFGINHDSKWDNNSLAASISIGAALENIHLQASALNLTDQVQLSPLKQEKELIAVISFNSIQSIDNETLVLSKNIDIIRADRGAIHPAPLPLDFFRNLQYFVKSEGNIQVLHTENADDIKALAGIAGASHRLQLLDADGHNDFYGNINWDEDETKKGIPLSKMGFSDGEIAGYSVAKDWAAVSLLSRWNKGNVFNLMAIHKAAGASAMLLIAINGNDTSGYIKAGRIMERIWLYSCSQGVTVQPLVAQAIVFNRLNANTTLRDKEREEIKALKDKVLKIFPLNKEYERDAQLFLIKLAMPAGMNV